eukprot:11788210-Alexandrium_andersonii.AAC.1
MEEVLTRATTIAAMTTTTATVVGVNSPASTKPQGSSGPPEKETCSEFTLPPIPRVPQLNEWWGK